ncbi:hypothetical protein EBZ80_22655 [bacterium]|nr:hypothetical protein [Betaproteobacteria bacterium]NDE17729.1 hypothetical protein [bacterium]
MPRPGFYNDNEYRAYPFVYNKPDTLPALPTHVILDAGFIMGLDAKFDDTIHTVWLKQINKVGYTFEFVFATNASPATVSFFRSTAAGEWENEYAESVVDTANPCADEPIWSGFIVTGSMAELAARFVIAAVGGTWAFQENDYQIEPGLLQNLNKAYLRSISVGNYDRVRVPPCDVTGINDNRPVVLNARCMKGDIRLKEGYNCLITQTERANEISVTASKGAGAGATSAELCANGSEVPLYPGEQLPPDSKFYSGGPACNEIISTINGVGGSNVNLIGGAGINILIDNGTITVQKKPNAQVNCT